MPIVHWQDYEKEIAAIQNALAGSGKRTGAAR